MIKSKFWPLVPIIAALLFTILLLLLIGSNPLDAGVAIVDGAFGSQTKALNTMAFWVPLFLCSLGLLITFTAGLWNIGVEGQMVFGAIAATAVALNVSAPRPVLITLEIIAAMLGGALWASLTAVLKTRGKVNEIFGGLALNNLAIILSIYLISGPWHHESSFTKTKTFADEALLARLAGSKFSLLSLLLSLVLFFLVFTILRGTRWGLKLKALGKNPYSAYLLGVSSERETVFALMFCGALAGLAGGVRVLSWHSELRQGMSGGIGFLALLVVMLASYRVLWVPLIAFFFSAVLQGSVQLQTRMQLHSSIGSILTGVMVLFVLLFGDRTKIGKRSTANETTALPEDNAATEAS